MRKFLPAVALSAFVLTGCFERPEVEEATEVKGKTDASPAEKSPAGPKPVERSSMEGTWVVQASMPMPPQGQPGWIPLALLKISRESQGFVPALVAFPPNLSGLRVKSSEISEKAAHIVLARENADFDIRVVLDKTDAPGNYLRDPTTLSLTMPARLLATNESRLEVFPPAPHAHQHEVMQAIEALVKQRAPEALEAFTRKYPRSALAYYAKYSRNPLLTLLSPNDPRPDPKEVREHVRRLDSLGDVWGPRAALLAKLEFAHHLFVWKAPNSSLFRKNANLEVAAEIARAADTPENVKLLNDIQKQRLEALKLMLLHEQNVVAALDATDPKRRAEAVAEIDRLLETAPRYQPWSRYALAEANRKAGNAEKALEQYARLLVMPAATDTLNAELEARWRKPVDLRKQTDELWKKTKKPAGAAGLDGYLSQAYRKLMRGLLPDLVATRPPRFRTRMHLVEMFTSVDDKSSIGPDVATQIVQRTHKPVDVVVLRYHLDNPQPNPLVCNDGKLRAFDCQIASSPMVLVDGKPLTVQRNGQLLVPPVRSNMAGVPYVLSLVRRAMQSESTAEPSKHTLRVAASAQAGKLNITAEVDGPQMADPDLRLRIVLAEDRIPYEGENGIRYHDMVVRSLPAGIDGVPLKAGKTTYTKTVDLAELSGRLRDFLASLEEKSGGKVKLSKKPVTFKKLHVVAFVQSTKGSREVVQVARAVVDGLESSSAPAPKKTAKKP